MTNEEYIREKRNEKFNVLWELKVPKFPVISGVDSTSKKIYFKGRTYYFNKQKTKSGETYLVCRTGRGVGKDEKIEDKMVYAQNDMRDIFCDFATFRTDVVRALNAMRERKNALPTYEYDMRREIDQSIRRYQLQEEYASAFFAYLRWSVKKENDYVNYNLDGIKSWIQKCSQEKYLSSRYYAFLSYKIAKIRKFFNVSIANVLLDKRDEEFIIFCKRNGFNTFFPLLVIPYYSFWMIRRFGIETIERVIREVKTFLDIHISYDDYITSSDIEEL